MGVGWLRSKMGIEWDGVGIGCGSCGMDWDESRVLFRSHMLSI